MKIVKKIKSKEAQAMVEYILVVALLSLTAAGVNKMFGKALKSYFGKVSYYRAGVIGQMP